MGNLVASKLNSSSCRSFRATRRSAGIVPPPGERAGLDGEPRRLPRHDADLPHSAAPSQRAPNAVRRGRAEIVNGLSAAAEATPGAQFTRPMHPHRIQAGDQGKPEKERHPRRQGGGPENPRGPAGQPPWHRRYRNRAAAARACKRACPRQPAGYPSRRNWGISGSPGGWLTKWPTARFAGNSVHSSVSDVTLVPAVWPRRLPGTSSVSVLYVRRTGGDRTA